MKKFGMLTLVAVATAMTASAGADVVTLKAGKRIQGAVIHETKTEVQIQTDLGKLTYSMDAVASVQRNGLSPEEVLADTAVKDERFKAALNLLEKAKEEAPKDSEAYKRVNAKIKSIEEFIPQFANTQAGLKLAQANVAYTAQNYDEAFAIIESAGDELQNSSEHKKEAFELLAKIYVGRGKNAQNKQNWVMSVEQFKAATEADPELVEAWMLYASAMLRDKNTEEIGLQTLEQWLDKGKADLPAAEQYRYNMIIGQKLKDRGQYTKSIPYFGECLKLVDAVVSNGAEAYDALSECLMGLTKAQWTTINTEYYLTLLDQVRGGSGDSFYLLKSILMGHNGDYAGGWKTLRSHLSQKSRSERRSLMTEGWLRGNAGESDAVMQDFREYGLVAATSDWEALTLSSWLFMLENNNDDATTVAEKAICAAPHEWGPVFSLAEAAYAHAMVMDNEACKLSDSLFKNQTDLEVARKALRQARRLSPGNPTNYILTARVLTAQQDFDSAKKYLDLTEDYLKTVELENFEVKKLKQQLILAQSNLEFSKGNQEQAEALLKKAAAELPSDPTPKSQALLTFKWHEIKQAYMDNMETTATLVSEAVQLGNEYLENPGRDAVMVRKMLHNLSLIQSGEELPAWLSAVLHGENPGIAPEAGAAPTPTLASVRIALMEQESAKALNPAGATAIDEQITKIKKDAQTATITLTPDDEAALQKYVGLITADAKNGQPDFTSPLRCQMSLAMLEEKKVTSNATVAAQMDAAIKQIKTIGGDAATAQLSEEDAKTLADFKTFMTGAAALPAAPATPASPAAPTPGMPAPGAPTTPASPATPTPGMPAPGTPATPAQPVL